MSKELDYNLKMKLMELRVELLEAEKTIILISSLIKEAKTFAHKMRDCFACWKDKRRPT